MACAAGFRDRGRRHPARQSQRARAACSHVGAQLLRGRQGHRGRRHAPPPARHHLAWRRAHPQRRRQSGDRPARAHALLLGRIRHRADLRCGARGHRRADQLRRGRARHRLARLPRRRRGHGRLLRDRPRDHPHRARSEAVHFPDPVPPGRADPPRRRAAHARGCARRHLRPDRGRRFHLRRHPDPFAHPRGDGDLSEEAQAARHRGDARVEPLP